MSRKRSFESKGREFWRRTVAEWRDSGVSQQVFARSRGLAPSTLARWNRTLGGNDVLVREEPPLVGFVEVVSADDGASRSASPDSWTSVARLAVGGALVEFASLPPAEYLVSIGVLAERSR